MDTSGISNTNYNRNLWLANGKIDSIVASMTLEEKVGQVFISFIYGEELTPLAIDTIKQSKLGNIIYYSWANGLS